MSHSKRNTTRPVFTSYERNLAKTNWSATSARLSRDSFLPFGSCGLCLEIAREPVACPQGDVFCRECALVNLLAQKKELKRLDKENRNAEQEAARIRTIENEEEHERAVHDFEILQSGLSFTFQPKSEIYDTPVQSENNGVVLHPGVKRKLKLDEDELLRIAKEDRAKARKAIEDEKASKPTLSSFWTPSLTPNVEMNKLSILKHKAKTAPSCPSSTEGNIHLLSLQKLLSIQFTEETDSSSKDIRRICPSCRKQLTNSSTPVMAEKCGHALCLKCVEKFLVPPEKSREPRSEPSIACFVCDVPVAIKSSTVSGQDALPLGFIKLKSEGTGFSSRGSSTVEKSGVAFQC